MEIQYSNSFIRSYKKLPDKAKKNFLAKAELLKADSYDSRLSTHKLKGRLSGYHAMSLDFSLRAIFKFGSKKVIVFVDIGSHKIYE